MSTSAAAAAIARLNETRLTDLTSEPDTGTGHVTQAQTHTTIYSEYIPRYLCVRWLAMWAVVGGEVPGVGWKEHQVWVQRGLGLFETSLDWSYGGRPECEREVRPATAAAGGLKRRRRLRGEQGGRRGNGGDR